jgi:hypothetical protein
VLVYECGGLLLLFILGIIGTCLGIYRYLRVEMKVRIDIVKDVVVRINALDREG